MKQFLITAAGVFAGLTIFLIGVPILIVSLALAAAGPTPPPARTILQLDLREPLSDQRPHSALLGLTRNGGSVMSIIETLKRAGTDDHVKGILVRLPEGGLEPGAADEIRQALLRFRATGKPVIAHSQGVYASGVVTATYMVGAAADQIWLQPGASLQVTGLATEDVFFKRFFDRYGIVPQFERRAEYKNAVNGYLYPDYTPEHREATLSWMGSVYASNLAAAANDRKADPAQLQKTLEAGPYLADEALRLKLVDRLGQVREAQQALLDRAGKDAELLDFDDYSDARRDRDPRAQDVIAVIEGEGAIVTGKDQGSNPFTGGATIYSDDLAEAILKASRQKSVKAIVLRISSPGGSDTASEQILDAIRAAKARGKPVVVSMGTYGASGGYWIASEASAIIAQPTTLTGSIGVFGGKFAVGPGLARYGVDLRETGVGGPFAAAYALGQPFSPDQRAQISRLMDRIYAEFVSRVATGRKLSPEQVQTIARGRVWTGAQARALGLVDEIGGFYQAVDKAKTLAGLKGEPTLRRMTPSEGALETLQRALGVSVGVARTLAAASFVLGETRSDALIGKAVEMRLRDGSGGAVLAPTPAF